MSMLPPQWGPTDATPTDPGPAGDERPAPAYPGPSAPDRFGPPPTLPPRAEAAPVADKVEARHKAGDRVWYRWTDENYREDQKFGTVVEVNADSLPTPTVTVSWYSGGHAVLHQDDLDPAD